MSGAERRDDRIAAAAEARRFFEELWSGGDPWELGTSGFERARHRRQLELLAGRRYARALEIGCGAGDFTTLLAPLAGRVLAIDVAPSAIERARERHACANVEFRVADVMNPALDAEAPWDLVVMSETVYYLGWLYSFFDVGWLAHRLREAVEPGGRLLLSNTQGVPGDYLVSSWIIRTYHDLFGNAGFELEREDVWRGVKDGTELEVLTSLFARR